MRPEQRIANKLLQKHSVTPPVDIVGLISHYANIEYDVLPCGADALLLYRSKKTDRPLIIVSSEMGSSRQRFTLAHELAHIVIPWHIGRLLYRETTSAAFEEYTYKNAENEANRFASELLLPTDWVANAYAESEGSFLQTIHRCIDTGVSATASAIAIARSMPPGFLVVECHKLDGRVLFSSSSEGTKISRPTQGAVYQPGTHLPGNLGITTKRCEVKGSVFYWHEVPSTDLPSEVADQDSGKLLTGIIQESLKRTDWLRAKNSINGIVGSTKNTNGQSASAFFNALRTRMLGDAKLKKITEHPDFEAYIRRRVFELFGE